MYPFCRARKVIGEGGKRGRVPSMSHMIPLVPWEVMIKYKHKTYLFPWVSVRHISMNAVSLQNVTQHDEVMPRRKFDRNYFLWVYHMPLRVYAAATMKMCSWDLREKPLWGPDWLTVPAVTSGSTTALEQSSWDVPSQWQVQCGYCCTPFLPNTLCYAAFAWKVSQSCTAVWGSSHFIPPSYSFCVHQASSYSLCLGPLWGRKGASYTNLKLTSVY